MSDAGSSGCEHEASLVDSGNERSPPKRVHALSAKKLTKFNDKIERSGIVYMSRVPPHLKPLKLRQMLEIHASIGRIYMAPKDPGPRRVSAVTGKSSKQGKQFSEAWIEFEDKKMGRAVAEMLNGNAMGGKHRSRYKDDLWTLKYLPKFKWDHLTTEVAHQKAVREKKLAQELSASKRERDFYLSKVAQAKKNDAIVSRKRQKGEIVEQGQKNNAREFTQREPLEGTSKTTGLSADVLSLFAS